MAASRMHQLAKEAQRIALDLLEDDVDYLNVVESVDLDPPPTEEELERVYNAVCAEIKSAYLYKREEFYGY